MMFVCSQEFTWVHVHVVYVHVHVHVHVVYSTYMCMCNVGPRVGGWTDRYYFLHCRHVRSYHYLPALVQD